MAQNSTVSLTLKIVGNAGTELKKISDQQINANNKINQQWAQIGSVQARFVNTVKAGTKETVNTARASDQLLRTNRMLEGVLRQQSIQTKLQSQQLKQQKNSAQQMADYMQKVSRSSSDTSSHATTTAGTWKDAAKSLLAMYGTMQAMAAIKSTITTNLDFERDVLEMKQNAGMTAAQASNIRQVAIDSADYTLQTPQEVFKASKAFARAGDKYEDIKGNTIEAARAATVFRSTPEQIANMDFDLRTKFGIKNEDISKVNNMLYYHGNAGRFEATSFAQFSPEMLSAMQGVGLNGIGGANFTGALTQVLMNRASVNEPSKVKTYIEQGLGNITAERYVKNLNDVGIDVKKYMPNGRFYGDDGTQGLFDLVEEMKNKGLENPFQLSKAGFQDQEAKKFWLSMMQYSDDIKQAMQGGQLSAKNDQIGIDLAEMQQSNFGKLKQAEIKIEEAKLSDSGQKVANATGTMSQLFSENPVLTTAGAASAGMYGYTTVQGVKANGMLNSSRALAKAGAVTTVGLGAYDAYSAYKNPNLSQHQKNVEYTKAGTSTVGALAGGWAGAKIGAGIGAGIGSVVPVVGTAAGAAVGGLVGGAAGGIGGWWLGGKAGEEIGERIDSTSENQIQAVQQQNELIQSGNSEIIGRLDTLIAATNAAANKPPMPVFIGGGSLLESVGGAAQKESTRQSTVPTTPLIFRR